MRVRPAAHAGRFYPGDPESLRIEVERLLQAARSVRKPTGDRPRALICPHAGYVYSGPVAASAYCRLEEHAADMSWGKIGFSIDAGRFDTSSKSASPSPTVDAGTQLTYTVVIRNTNADAFGVTMVDPVPANTTYVPGSATASSGTVSEAGGQINWSGSVAVGVPVTVTFRVTVNAPLANGTVIVNTANIYEGGILKASPSCTVTVRSWPDLRASYKVCSPKMVRADDPFTNTIVLHNVGTDHALAVDVTDSVPAYTTYVAGSATATGGSVAFDSGGNRVVTLAPAADQSGTTTITLTVSDGAASTPAVSASAVPMANTVRWMRRGSMPSSARGISFSSFLRAFMMPGSDA